MRTKMGARTRGRNQLVLPIIRENKKRALEGRSVKSALKCSIRRKIVFRGDC